MSTMLYAGGLPADTTSADLEKIFAPYGTVVRARVVTGKETSPASAYGLVTMASKEDARHVLEGLSTFELDGRRLSVVHLTDEAIATLGFVPDH